MYLQQHQFSPVSRCRPDRRDSASQRVYVPHRPPLPAEDSTRFTNMLLRKIYASLFSILFCCKMSVVRNGAKQGHVCVYLQCNIIDDYSTDIRHG